MVTILGTFICGQQPITFIISRCHSQSAKAEAQIDRGKPEVNKVEFLHRLLVHRLSIFFSIRGITGGRAKDVEESGLWCSCMPDLFYYDDHAPLFGSLEEMIHDMLLETGPLHHFCYPKVKRYSERSRSEFFLAVPARGLRSRFQNKEESQTEAERHSLAQSEGAYMHI